MSDLLYLYQDINYHSKFVSHFINVLSLHDILSVTYTSYVNTTVRLLPNSLKLDMSVINEPNLQQ